MTNNKKSNLDYNVQDKKSCFNSRNHINFTDTARQITDNDCSNDAIAELIRVTRDNLHKEN